MNSIFSFAVLLASVAAAAQSPSVQSPQLTLESAAASDASRPTHRLGILLDAGLPDGFGLSVAFRPGHWIRLELGMLENTVSPGIRGGLTLLPFNFWITPTLTLEAGHYFAGDANSLARLLSHNQTTDSPLLRDFSYDYANAHLGLELGTTRVAFFIRGGVSYVKSTLHHVQLALQQSTGDASLQASDVGITYRGPSAKLGFIVYFL